MIPAATELAVVLTKSLREITDMIASLSIGYSSHPLRRSGCTNFWPAEELTFRFARSQCRRSPVQLATFPSSKVSVTRPSNSKFPPGLVLPPLQASSHSRSLPGERGSVFGGGTKLRIFSSGISRGFSPLNPQKILP